MPQKRIAERARELRREIRRHDYLYYVKNQPAISDEAYDRLFAELRRLEDEHPELTTPDSPTQRVGAPPLEEFSTVEHAAPMLSLDASTEEATLRRFDERLRSSLGDDIAYVVEPKLDGTSIEVVYEAGGILRASTRGDGRRGEGITENVKTIGSVPLRLSESERPAPRFLSVRGEVIMRISAFRELTEAMLREGQTPFANPRNAAAGSLRQLNSSITARRPLVAIFYDVLAVDGDELSTQWEVHRALEAWGFAADSRSHRARTADDVLRYHQNLERERDRLDYEIDGVVVKLDRLAPRRRLGETAHHPRWAFAFKFPPRRQETRVLSIAPSVGRTGIVTPVALLRPAEIGGATVSRASLHNREEVERKDIREGDLVRLTRAGDVIPYVLERVKEPGKRRGPPYRMPERCPSCGARLEEDGPLTVCPNGFDCPAQQVGSLIHFGSRDALDIDGLGEEVAGRLVAAGLVRSPAGLFDLEPQDLLSLERFGELSAQNLVDAIQRASGPGLDRFLYALGIPSVGRKIARDLAEHFGSLEALRRAGEEELVEVPGVGPKIARSIAHFLADERNQEVIDELLDGRVNVKEPGRRGRRPLEGLTFVFTGSLERLSRSDAEDLVEEHGARASSSVSSNTDYLVAGESPGSKLDRARELGVEILDERGFERLLERRKVRRR